MTSLIDVIFLLLLFFMLTSTFTRFSDIPLQSGQAGPLGDASTAPPALLQLNQNGQSLNGIPTDFQMVLHALDALGEQPSMLIVQLGEGVTSQRLVDFLVMMQSRPTLPLKVLE